MPTLYDLFASYAHDDDEHGHITAFIEQLKAAHRSEFKDSDFNIFFDQREIRTGHDWEDRIATGLRRSRLFLAFTSPAYYASEYCCREWQEWIDQEIATQILGEGAFPIYTLALPSLNPGTTPEQHSRFLAELADAIRQRADTLTRSSPARAASLRARAEAIIGRGQPIIRQAALLSRRQSLGRRAPAGEILPLFPDGADELRRGALADILRQLATGLREKESLVQTVGNRRSYVPDYNRHFSGRIEELLTLRKHLTDDRNGTFAGIHGLGGMGKTELAFAYAHAYGHYYPGGRYLLPCENAEDLRFVLTRLEGNPLPVVEGDARKDLELYYRLLLQSLRDHVRKEGRTLLVLDNVTRHALLSPDQTDHLANFDGQIHILATTRDDPPRAQTASGRIHWIPLDRLDEDSARDLLRKHRDFEKEDHALPSSSEADEYRPRIEGPAQVAASEIVTLLGGFTLATELVGSFLAVHPAVSYAEMACQLRADSLDQLDQAAEDRDIELRRHNNEKRLQSILDWTLQKLTKTERDILNLAALPAPDYIVLSWLHQLAVPRHPQLAGPGNSHPDHPWQRVLARLTSLSLLSRSPKDSAGERILRSHRLLQKYLMKEMTEQHALQNALEETIIDHDAELQIITNWQSARWEIPALHALALRWDEEKQPLARWLMNQVGQCWFKMAEWSQAELLQRRVLLIDESKYGPEDRRVAVDITNLALTLKTTNRLTEAETLFWRALKILESSYGPHHPIVAASLNNVGDLLRATNRLSEAEQFFRRALKILESSDDPQHPHVAGCLNNLGDLLREANRLAEAEPMLRRALQIDEAIYGLDHPQLAKPLTHLGLLLDTTNRAGEAETMFRRALRIVEVNYGLEHPEVARELNNLANLLSTTNRMAEAEPLYRRALQIDEASYGPHHPAIANRLCNLAILLSTTNRMAEAEPLYRRALQIDEASYGLQHPTVAIGLCNLAKLLHETSRIPEAEPLFRRALQIIEASYGPGHPEVADVLNNLASLLRDTNRLAEAEALIRRALLIHEGSYGANHPNVAIGLNNLASLLRDTNRLAEAEPLLRRALQITEFSLGPKHPKVAIRLNNLATVLHATERLAEAEQMYRRALQIIEASYGPGHPEVASSLNNLAKLLESTQRLAEAEQMYRQMALIYLRFTRQTGHLHRDLRLGLRSYATLLLKMKGNDGMRPVIFSLGPEAGVPEVQFREILTQAFGS